MSPLFFPSCKRATTRLASNEQHLEKHRLTTSNNLAAMVSTSFPRGRDLRNTRHQAATHPFGYCPPVPGTALKPPLQSGPNVRTKAGLTSNTHEVYANIKTPGQIMRFDAVNAIASHWRGTPVTAWFPEANQPHGLPLNPLDWSGEYLYWFRELAKATENDIALAHHFLREVAKQRGGSEDAKLGSTDVKAATLVCIEANGRMAAQKEHARVQAAPGVADKMEIEEKPQPAPSAIVDGMEIDAVFQPLGQGIAGVPDRQKFFDNGITDTPLGFWRVEKRECEGMAWLDNNGQINTKCKPSHVEEKYGFTPDLGVWRNEEPRNKRRRVRR